MLPRHDRAGRSLAFAACRKADDILGVINVEYIGVGTAEVGLIVRSDLKSRGVGSLLLSHVMEWSRTSGLKQLIGHIMIDNKAMLRLAYAAGFRCVGGNETLVEMIWPAPSAA
ncbi:MAG: GNAT family N-acetyltransferase [Mesorhizobium sp.]